MIPTTENPSSPKHATGAPTARACEGEPWLVNRPYLGKSHGITIYEGGNLVHLQVPKFKSKAIYKEGRNRGKIGEFSYKSRQRLMRKIAMIDSRAAGLPVFLTVTYPEEWSSDWEDWKRHLHNFRRDLVRRYLGVWGVWKMEFQKRGAPHFHLMLWGLPEIKGTEHVREGKLCWRVLPGHSCESDLEVFNWLNETWFRVVGSQDAKHLAAGINLEPVQSWRGVTSYVSKYLGKTAGGEFVPVEFTGRFWGVVQGGVWKLTKLDFDLTEDQFFRYRRVLRKLYERVSRRIAREARGKGLKVPAWTKKRDRMGRIPQGVHWYLDSLSGLRLLGWAAG